MNFYNLWNETRLLNVPDDAFIKDFLSCSPSSTTSFLKGNHDDMVLLSKTLLNISIKEFVDYINTDYNYSVTDIPQFSNFEHAILDVNIIISMCGPLDFTDLGKMIINAKLEGACKKYGENHSKTAAMFGLVDLNKTSRYLVSNTSFGQFSIALDKNDKKELLKRIALRNPFIKTIIYYAKKGNADYSELTASLLSTSTSLRRKSNVKKIVTFILENTEVAYLLNNIIW